MSGAIVVGAGLAGCEAAWQLACRGVSVTLREMKPQEQTPAHHSADFAELVCSNSLRGAGLSTAPAIVTLPSPAITFTSDVAMPSLAVGAEVTSITNASASLASVP